MADMAKVHTQLTACDDLADVMTYVRHCEHLLRRQSEKLHDLPCSDHTRNADDYLAQALIALGSLLAEEGIDPV